MTKRAREIEIIIKRNWKCPVCGKEYEKVEKLSEHYIITKH
jgi:ribosomal protein L37AE/L43A